MHFRETLKLQEKFNPNDGSPCPEVVQNGGGGYRVLENLIKGKIYLRYFSLFHSSMPL